MLWIVIAGLCTTAVGYRVFTLGGRRPEVWWVAFTITLIGIVAGSGFLTAEQDVNRVLGVPNVAYLLSNFSFVIAAASVQVYVHTLRRARPSARLMVLHVSTAAVVAVIIAAGWLAAPIHHQWYPTFRDVPFTPEAVAYQGLFHLYLGVVLVNVAVGASQQIKATPHADPGRLFGLVAIAISASLDVAAHALYLAQLFGAARGNPPAFRLASTADVVTAIAMTGIVSGTVAFLLIPRLVIRLRARHLISELRPLWLKVRELQPGVALPTRYKSFTEPTVQAERMMIEIGDGLRLIHVPSRAHQDPYRLVAGALLQPAPTGALADTLLPTPTSRHDEETVVLSLAQAYVNLRTEMARAS